MNKTFQELLNKYLADPRDPYVNLELGQHYDALKQSAGAMSFYLRTAELTQDKDLAYDCLVRNALLIEKLQRRPHSAKGQLQHAIALIPTRPEAYFHLTRFYEQKQEWQEIYTAVVQAQTFKQPYSRTSNLDLDYPGDYVLDFQKAVAAWWINRGEESAKTFKYLLDEYEMRWDFTAGCINNLKKTKQNIYVPLRYGKDLQGELKVPFENLQEIQQNFSEAYQDMFVLTMLDGKKEGTYLEIGSADPFKSNNTALLETVFNWKGVSVEYLEQEASKFNENRRNKCIQADARDLDYAEILKDYGQDIDYLQLDCDPPEVTYQILEKIPFDLHRFAVITYEHDAYQGGTEYRIKSREFLSKAGYILVVGDIAPDKNRAFEDWWVHPELVSKNILDKMISISGQTKRADLYMQGEYR